MTPSLLIMTLALAGAGPRVDFDTQVVPVLTKAGCNAGACHGAAAGRGGFRLSLWGGDAAADYDAIVRELEGRRVNLARPDESLILAKPSGRTGHGGGLRLAAGSAGERILREWIAAGAPRTSAHRRTFVRLDVEPAATTLSGTHDEARLTATAHFSDGSREDVTAWTVFAAADPAAVEVRESDEGRVVRANVLRPGQHVVIARFLSAVAPIELVLPFGEAGTHAEGGAAPERGFIDAAIEKKLAQLGLAVSPPADDAAFLRRARLDLTGRLPVAGEVRAFLADTRPDRRERLVERLIRSDEFVDFWTYRFASVLRVRDRGGPQGFAAAEAYHEWLREQVARGTGFHRVARTLLLATGDPQFVGPANFYRSAGDAREQAELASEVFLGVRLRCANCHDHPLDRWTQDDYHGLAAVFARVERAPVVRLGERGEVTHPGTGAPALPRIPGERFLADAGDLREAFAGWLTGPDNPYFARAVVNRLWKWTMGRGLIEPADDLSQTNPATHPELLELLAADFVEHGYDVRRTLWLIATSEAYGRSPRSVPGNEADDRFYARAIVRPLEAEVLADAISDATGVAEVYGEGPTRTERRAVQLVSPTVASLALDVLGRCDRAGSCDGGPVGAAGAAGPGLRAKLHAINGPLLNRKVAAAEGWLHRSLAAATADAELLEECYLRTLNRPPGDDEREYWLEQLARAATPDERTRLWEDVLWSVLSCREFQSRR